MAAPKHEAFIDLENTLADQIKVGWRKQWVPISKRIQRAINIQYWDLAHEHADKIDLTPVAKKNRKLARTIGTAALFLGHSRIVDLDDADVSTPDQQSALENMMIQFDTLISVNMTNQTRAKSHKLIEQARAETLEIKKAAPVIFGSVVGSMGDTYATATSSLYVSRMNSYGFMNEALTQGYTHYQVNEVMDRRTCPVCREMDARVFTVQQGATQAMTVMQNDDPDSLRELAPFPSQSKANVAAISGKTSTDLANDGLSLPPYHPLCRGIVSQTTSRAAGRGISHRAGRMADDLIARANKTKDETTALLENLAGKDAKMTGLDFKVKTRSSLTRKIRDTSITDEISLARAADDMGDVLRYTMEIPPSKYVDKVDDVVAAMEARGYKFEKFKNTWKKPGEPTPIYQGINTNVRAPNGQIFEVQFHTPSSFTTKEVLNHKMFETYRKITTSQADIDRLYLAMQKNQMKVKIPKGVENLKAKTGSIRARTQHLIDERIDKALKQVRKVDEARVGRVVLGEIEAERTTFTTGAEWGARFDDATFTTQEQVLARLTPYERNKVALIEKTVAKQRAKYGTTEELYDAGFGEYTTERAAFHNHLLDQIFEDWKKYLPAAGEDPYVAYLGGRGGSGKSFFTKEGGPLYDIIKGEKALKIDSDEIKAMLTRGPIKYNGWNASLVHDEASHIVAMAEARIKQYRINAVLDKTLSGMDVYKEALAFKQAGYNVEAFYMHLPKQEAVMRAVRRSLGGDAGRYVPIKYVLGSTTNEAVWDAVRRVSTKYSFMDAQANWQAPVKLISRKVPSRLQAIVRPELNPEAVMQLVAKVGKYKYKADDVLEAMAKGAAYREEFLLRYKHFPDELGGAAMKKAVDELSDIELWMINNYTQKGHAPINHGLWARMDTTYGKNLATYRDLINRALAKLPDNKGVFYRGRDFKTTAQLQGAVETYQPGAIVEFPGFTSASRNPNVTYRFGSSKENGVLFVIKNKTGRNITGLAEFTEGETLFNAGTHFKVTAVKRGDAIQDIMDKYQLTQRPLERAVTESAEFISQAALMREKLKNKLVVFLEEAPKPKAIAKPKVQVLDDFLGPLKAPEEIGITRIPKAFPTVTSTSDPVLFNSLVKSGRELQGVRIRAVGEKGTSSYNAGKQQITIAHRGSDLSTLNGRWTLAHEMGHHIDYEMGTHTSFEGSLSGSYHALGYGKMVDAVSAKLVKSSVHAGRVEYKAMIATLDALPAKELNVYLNAQLKKAGITDLDFRGMGLSTKSKLALKKDLALAIEKGDIGIALKDYRTMGRTELMEPEVNDFFGSITMNKVGKGHGNTYYHMAQDARETETFANWIAARGAASSVELKLMEYFAKPVTDAFEKILKAYGNNYNLIDGID